MRNHDTSLDENGLVALTSVDSITLEELVSKVEAMQKAKMRFVSITCYDRIDHFQLMYHFDKDLTMHTLQLDVPKDATVPSVSFIYFCAFLPENEMRDLFGVKVDGLAVDYGGRFLVTNKIETPLLKDEEQRAAAAATAAKEKEKAQ